MVKEGRLLMVEVCFQDFTHNNMKNKTMFRASSKRSTAVYREVKTYDLRLICNEVRASCLSTTHGAPSPFAGTPSLRPSNPMSQWLGVFDVLVAVAQLQLACVALLSNWRCAALGTQQQHPVPLLSSCSLPRLNLLCAAFAATAVFPSDDCLEELTGSDTLRSSSEMASTRLRGCGSYLEL